MAEQQMAQGTEKDIIRENLVAQNGLQAERRTANWPAVLWPVLNVIGEHDVVHPKSSLPMVELTSKSDEQNCVLPTGHMDTAASSEAQTNLCSQIEAKLQGSDEKPASDRVEPPTKSTPPHISPSGRGGMDSPSSRRAAWEQEIVTPAQFTLPARESLAIWTGERRLLLAVLKEAIHTYRRYCHARTRREKRLFDEAQEWILSRDPDGLYTFESICSYLDLDPDFIRTGLPRKYEQPASLTLPAREHSRPANEISFAQTA